MIHKSTLIPVAIAEILARIAQAHGSEIESQVRVPLEFFTLVGHRVTAANERRFPKCREGREGKDCGSTRSRAVFLV